MNSNAVVNYEFSSYTLCPLNHSSRTLDPQCLSRNFKLQRMYLIWTCRDVKEFIWFLELMISTQKHVSDQEALTSRCSSMSYTA